MKYKKKSLKNLTMIRLLYNVVLFTALLLPFATQAETDEDMSRKERRSFSTPGEISLELINKYGDIIIHTWDKDSVRAEVTITAHGKKDSGLRKMLDRVDIEMRQTGSYIRLESELDRSSGSISEFFKNIGDQSRTLLSKNKLEVNWVIYLPERAEVILENKFGDIFMEAVHGKSRIDLAHGNIRSNGLHGYSRLTLSYGEADIDYIKEAYLEGKVYEVFINKADYLTISGSSSEYSMKEVKTLKMDSRNDDIRINTLYSLTGTSSFSKISIKHLRQQVDANLKYGELSIDLVQKGFSKLVIKAQSTDVSLHMDDQAGYIYDITAEEDRLTLPRNMQEESRDYPEDKNKYVHITGKGGPAHNSPSRIRIDAEGGSLDLGFSILQSPSVNH